MNLIEPTAPKPKCPVRLWCISALLAGLACARTDASELVSFYPDWFPGTEFAGIYAAVDNGYYQEAGLEITFHPFAFGQKSQDSISTTPDICSLGSVEGYIFLQKRAAGADLQALGVVLQESPAGIMSLQRTGLTGAKDFAGKTIGMHKFADPVYHWLLRQAGLPEAGSKMVTVGNDLDLLTGGKIDAMQGFASEEFVQLRQRVGDEARFLSFRELGFDSYSEILFTTPAQLARHRDAIQRFLLATRRGWIQALAHPDEAVESVARRIGPTSDRAFLRASLEALRPFVAPEGKKPLARMDAAKWTKIQKTCIGIGFIKTAEPVEKFLAHDLISTQP
jgi:ABC-type nitrate/sulfonate/bicarbonate transport system substrate-binding protein